MSVSISEQNVRGWSGFLLRAGDLEVGLAPEIGGRIISFRVGGEELLFVQEEHAGETFDLGSVTDLRAKKRELGFRLWGGNKTWLAPQSAWIDAIPPLDLDAGPYVAERDGDAIVMTSPVCRETGARIVRRVSLDEAGLTLEETLINPDHRPLRRGLWTVTQMLRPFQVMVLDASFRPYPEEGDSMCFCSTFLQQNGRWTVISCAEPAHFKYGGRAKNGVILALREVGEKTLAFAKVFTASPESEFAHDAQVEVYNSRNFAYLEIETHAPLVQLSQGEEIVFTQQWRAKWLDGTPTPFEAAAALGCPTD
jgi:hypothetical protein